MSSFFSSLFSAITSISLQAILTGLAVPTGAYFLMNFLSGYVGFIPAIQMDLYSGAIFCGFVILVDALWSVVSQYILSPILHATDM